MHNPNKMTEDVQHYHQQIITQKQQYPDNCTQHINNPISIRLNADNSNPRRILCFWIVFFYVIAICVLLAVFVAPKQIVIKSNQTELKNTADHTCANPYGFQNDILICHDFGINNPRLGLVLRDVGVLNQFALIYLNIGIQTSSPVHSFNQQLSIDLYQIQLKISNDKGKFYKKSFIDTRNITFQDNDQSQQSFILYGQQIKHLIGFYRHLQSRNYLLVVNFSNVQQIISGQFKPVLKALLLNSQFTLFIIIIRAIGFIFTCITGSLFIYRYHQVEASQRLIEQKLVYAMSFLVLLFNDPFYFISIISPNTCLSVFSVIFLTQFIAYLFFFWILGAERILSEEGEVVSKILTLPKKIMYIVYFISYLVILTWYYSDIALSSYKGDFIVNPQQISPGLSIVFLLWLIINITIYGWLMLRIFKQNSMALWRSKIWLHFNCYFAILLTVFVIISGSFYQENSKLLLITYSSLNLYCIYMQFMFTVSKNHLDQVNKLMLIKSLDGQGNQNADVQLNEKEWEVGNKKFSMASQN